MLFESLLVDLDEAWDRDGVDGPTTLRVIGATALHLQVNYDRGTRDGDVLRVRTMDDGVTQRIKELAGPGSQLHRRHGMYIDVVEPDVPMLPANPLWHGAPQFELTHFSVCVLDVADVCISKLYRWNSSDREDVRRMVEMGHLDHGVFVARFQQTADHHGFESRAHALVEMVERLHELERDTFLVDESAIDLPSWIEMT